MAGTLIYAEVQKGEIKKGSFEVTSKAKELGGDVAVCLIGKGAEGLASQLAKYGADKIYVVDGPEYENYVTEAYVQAFKQVADTVSPTVILASATAQGKDLIPAIAARLNVGAISDCVDLKKEGDKIVAKRPMYAGKAYAMVEALANPQIIAVRPNSFAVKETAGAGAVEKVAVSLDTSKIKAVVKSIEVAQTDEPDQTEAEIIVSGGRGMKGPENFKMLEDLAKLFGPTATTGASRAAVDAGWREHSYQVGQTGKTVSPNLYIACGISGAIQHLAGMGTSKVIVAINKDAEAPIFQKADYGVVDDLFNVVPALIDEIKKVKG
ncbi:MAG: Acryloyl-CoA reductase electron transfer subunit beta [Deltaproteobacteria bacterium ADurb.BinA179]|jgi:electron transfer flavoprotein alpha subunit|nr:electron transfer flavoprotein subunit alpha/FixB family protein [Deltaproteobacteria bacterium]MDI9542872.1 electron transfer flavoprotein subunit alpha/FixB family protein [Pseudomonadota bacterium]NLW66257.1 electron transfer flavoprotein subunit alpha/FixB family protein [Bacteriovoracaceae bacterium]OPZ27563.1 MAG: Acryloyl-CoA reductase electron transfer subunit beta [Deltaproteobacteria bacterium ADurb.BinA179]HRR22299.1 electron transfer flavoprotein subunit alpha/FixB family protein